MANIIMCRTVSTEHILIPILIPIPMQMGIVPNLTPILVPIRCFLSNFHSNFALELPSESVPVEPCCIISGYELKYEST